jgi:hypothetical protein
METFDVVISLPTLNELFGWFVAWFCFGVMFNVAHAISFVWCDYGRTARELPWWAGIIMVFLDSLLWPANIKSIRDNLSPQRFNRKINYYM